MNKLSEDLHYPEPVLWQAQTIQKTAVPGEVKGMQITKILITKFTLKIISTLLCFNNLGYFSLQLKVCLKGW